MKKKKRQHSEESSILQKQKGIQLSFIYSNSLYKISIKYVI